MERRTFLNASLALATGTFAQVASTQAESSSQTAEATSEQNVKEAIEAMTTRLRPSIQNAREVALKILKPTDAELEKGLRIHAESVVFDSYGFAPRAALDGDILAEAMEAGASEIEIQDMRESMTMTRCVSNPEEQQEYRDAWKAAGVTCIFQNAGEEYQAPLQLIKRLARFTYVTDLIGDFVGKAVVPEDVIEAKKQGRHALCMTGNGVPLTQQWVSVPDEMRYMTVFLQLGIRMMHLTYQRRNMIGDGCGEVSDAGLSDFGRSVIAEMNRIGIIPDCAHSGWKTSLEAAQVSEKPMVASHTVCAALDSSPHARSKPDEVLKAIAGTGGLIGICCIPKFLRKSGDIEMLLNHIEHAVKTVGVDHVAIGTDVAHTSSNMSKETKKLPRAPRRRPAFHTLWPNDDFKTTGTMTNSVAWTNWPLFTVGLVQRGYSEEQIRKIIGGNVLRVLGDNPPRA